MSVRSLIIVLLALVCGLSAVFGINTWLGNRVPASTKPETVPVVVAARDIDPYTPLTKDLLGIQEFPKGLAPPGTFSRVEDVLERTTLTRMVKDEVLMTAKLSGKDAGAGVAPAIPQGMRAATIKVRDEAAGLAGLLEPGNKVDILFTPDAGGNKTTGTLLQSMTLLAVGKKLEASTGSTGGTQMFRSVTVLATPEESAKLELAQHQGCLHMILRNPLDQGDAPTLITLKDLRRPAEPPPAPLPPPIPKEEPMPMPEPEPARPDWTVTIRRGVRPPEVVPFYRLPDGRFTEEPPPSATPEGGRKRVGPKAAQGQTPPEGTPAN